MQRLFLWSAVCLLLAGCADKSFIKGPEFLPVRPIPPGKAIIYFYRLKIDAPFLREFKLYLNEVPLTGLYRYTYTPVVVDPGVYYVSLVPYGRGMPSVKFSGWMSAESGKEYFVELDAQRTIYGFNFQSADEGLMRIPLTTEMAGARNIPPALPVVLDKRKVLSLQSGASDFNPPAKGETVLTRIDVLPPEVKLFAENSETTAFLLPQEDQTRGREQFLKALSRAIQAQFGMGRERPARSKVIGGDGAGCFARGLLEQSRKRAWHALGGQLPEGAPASAGGDSCGEVPLEAGSGLLVANLYGLEGQGKRNLGKISKEIGLCTVTMCLSLLFTNPVLSDQRKGLVLELALLADGGKRVMAAGRKFSGGDATENSLAFAAGAILRCFDEGSGKTPEELDTFNQQSVSISPCRVYEPYRLKVL